MVNWTDLDLRYRDYAARIAQVNEVGWWRQESPPRRSRILRDAAVVAAARRHIGGAIVRVGEAAVRGGERLRGTPARPSLS